MLRLLHILITDTYLKLDTVTEGTRTMKYTNLDAIRGYSGYALASIADAGADNDAAAAVLSGVRDAVIEQTEYTDAEDWQRQIVDDHSGLLSQIADGAVPVYIGEKWEAFAGLHAWHEDVSEYSPDMSDLDALGSLAVYVITERLARAIAEEIAGAIEETDDDD